MSTGSHRESAVPSPKELTIVQWPLRDEPARSLCIIGAITAICAYASLATGQPLVGCVAFAALAICLWRLWLPVRFTLGPRGITQTVLGHSRRLAWRQVGGCQWRSRGLLLLRNAQDPTPLLLLNGLFIRYPAQRERLREVVEAWLR